MKPHSIRPRAVAVGLVLGALLCLATPYNNMYLGATPLGGGHFPLAPFIALVCLTVAVAGLARLTGLKLLLTGGELLVVWMLGVLVSGVAFTGLARTFFINVTALAQSGAEGGKLAQTLGPLAPAGLMVTDREAVGLLYNGLPGGASMDWLQVLAGVPWQAWAAPLAAWGVFIGLCYMVLVCLVNLFSKQWVVAERMNFPLLKLPYLMEEHLEEGKLGEFFGNRYLLAGLAVPLALHALNGLAFYVPSVPQIPTVILAGPYFAKTGLFSGFQKLKICLYPAFIGFAYLASRQISLSFWAFFILGGLLTGALSVMGYQIPASALGVTFGPTLASPEETQTIGAYAVFFFFILWLARKHLYGVLRDALRFRFKPASGSEWFSAPLSFWGLVLGGGGLTAWCAWFGMPWWQSAVMLAVFFIVTLVASRVICQGGLAYFTLTAAPTDGLLALFGSSFLAGTGLVLAAVMQKVQFLDLRESLAPSLVHAAKVGEPLGRKRLYLLAMGVALVIGVAASFTAMLALCHKVGIRELGAQWETSTVLGMYDNLRRLVEAPAGPNPWTIGFAALGAAVMLALVLCFQRFHWWPLHPIGYLTLYSSSMRILWFSFFVGWLCNQLTLRYGGVALFGRVRLFFVGLILGDFLMGGVFAAVGLFMGQSYQVLPG